MWKVIASDFKEQLKQNMKINNFLNNQKYVFYNSDKTKWEIYLRDKYSILLPILNFLLVLILPLLIIEYFYDLFLGNVPIIMLVFFICYPIIYLIIFINYRNILNFITIIMMILWFITGWLSEWSYEFFITFWIIFTAMFLVAFEYMKYKMLEIYMKVPYKRYNDVKRVFHIVKK